ncbi:MAG TPA: response regulator [Polyangiaceae bacterium]|jgi:two-component system response regulator RegA
MSDPEARSAEAQAAEGPRVLVVDDDRKFCAALAGALRRRGYRAFVAHSHEEALAEVEAWSPARAIVDLRLGGASGLELLAELKRRREDLEVIVLTGYGSIASAVDAMKLGAVHYLTKPAAIDDVLRAFESRERLPDSEPHGDSMPLEEVEWQHVQNVLFECAGNVSEAARRLGLHRRTLQRKLARRRR